MSDKKEAKAWAKYVEVYDPINVGSIDGKFFFSYKEIVELPFTFL